VNAARAWKRGGDLENATFEAKLIPRIEHTRAELETMVREGIELERQHAATYKY
jgi:hypothetical protein